ncbi:pilus assembly protein PilM [Candidatus Omnitrophota bacterium]
MFQLSKSKVITILELDGQWLKVVQAKPAAQGNKISKILVEKISSADQQVAARVGELAQQLPINQQGLLISLPSRQVIIRDLELPSANPAEIKNIVDLQVGKQTPYSKEEIIYDHQILSTNSQGYSRVMLAIAHRNIVDKKLKILERAGLKTENIGLSSEGLLRWATVVFKQRSFDRPYAIINLDFDQGNFLLIAKSQLVFSRNISVGFTQLQESFERWQDKFLKEVNHALHAYPHDMVETDVSRVVITGAGSLTEVLNESDLKNKLGFPIEVTGQFKNIPLARAQLADCKAKTKSVSVTHLLGFALGFRELRLNLIPAQLRIERNLRQRGRDLYFFGSYLVFILALISSIFLGRMYSREGYLNKLKQENHNNATRVTQLNKMIAEIELVKTRSLNKDYAINFIYEIHQAISPEIYLTLISFDGKEKLTLRGESNAMSEIFRFIEALEEIQYLQNVKTKFVSTRKAAEEEVTEFEIVCPLKEEFQQRLKR